MQFLTAITTCAYYKVFDWHSRACRSEFWWYMLFLWLVEIPLGCLATLPFIGIALYIICNLYLQWTYYMVLIRRLHDRDKSGWICLIFFLPFLFICFLTFFALQIESSIWIAVSFVGIMASLFFLFYLLYLLIAPGTVGPNRFGDDPLQELQNQSPLF